MGIDPTDCLEPALQGFRAVAGVSALCRGMRAARLAPGFNRATDRHPCLSPGAWIQLQPGQHCAQPCPPAPQKIERILFGEGASEALILEIPKGHYLPIFRAAGLPSVPEAKEDGHRPPEAPEKTSASTESNGSAARFPRFWLAVAACILILVSAIAIPWFRSKPPVGSMETFWSPFLSGAPPLVVYSNALFVTDSDHGVKVASVDATDFPHQAIRENYGALLTGTGAVIAVRQLTQLFDAHNANFTLKRSLLVTWDEARSTNLIFLGSRAQNPALTMLDSMKDFALLADSGIPTGFVNLHPKPGEPAVYSRPADFFTKDYAVIALSPGLQPSKWILNFSGLSTLGTEAAVEYACRPEDVASLLRAASLKPGELRPFEALLETKIVGGVPMPAKLVTIRTH